MKWQLLNSPFEQQFEAVMFTKAPRCRLLPKSLSAAKNVQISTTGML